jgi:hypothetical protein
VHPPALGLTIGQSLLFFHHGTASTPKEASVSLSGLFSSAVFPLLRDMNFAITDEGDHCMSEARELIAALHALNATTDRSVGRFTPSLVGMFGTTSMLELFLSALDNALRDGTVSEPLRRRAQNLVHTFIPQVAGYNGITDLSAQEVTPAQLIAIRADAPESRAQGVRLILAALQQILNAVIRLG